MIIKAKKSTKVFKGVVVVESPAKAKALGSFLGNNYKVIASYGHVRDLPSKNGAIDIEKRYKMVWQMNDRGRKQIKEISESLSGVDSLFLATDPDREGEAISWHIADVLRQKKLLKNIDVKRVVFHEITKSAIMHAFETPKDLDMNMVEAYLARRALDYLVGFSLSPILWRKMPGARSAGRVQSVALKLIVERELEVQAFSPDEYWSIHGDFATNKGSFNSSLVQFAGHKVNKMDIKDEAQATSMQDILRGETYTVERVEKKTIKRNPHAPFTTSSMQQDAVRKLGFSAKKTMQVAQKLYEGISIGEMVTGLITYMRTDSTSLSKEAIDGARKVIESNFGNKYLPKSAKVYKTKTKNAQEAHEAIRPTSFNRSPQELKGFLPNDEFRLYDLIWKRALSSQMESALVDHVSVDIFSENSGHKFCATGHTIAFDGFLKVYVEATDDDTEKEKDEKLPQLKEGETLNLKEINRVQHFTQPPPRFNEASLVKKLEELGIGRPSTYATIINILQERKYVTLQKKVFIPQNIGFFATSFLRNFFAKYIQYDFTANMEENLDDIANAKANWKNVLDGFWNEFNETIQNAGKLSITEVINMLEEDINDFIFKDFKENRKCPICTDGQIHLKLGKYGAFLGCSQYPECKFTQKLNSSNEGATESVSEPIKNEIGTDYRYENDTVFLKKGPFGYYFEWNKTKDAKNKKKPKRLGVSKTIQDPLNLTIDDALKLDSLPLDIGNGMTLCVGRFGPFIKFNSKSYKIKEHENFLRITFEEAKKITQPD